MKRLLKEPLIHFLLLGALLFVVYGLMSDSSGDAPDAIHISAGRIENLAAIFEKTWQRPPREKELDGLIQDYVREEAAYRSGLAMGLDQNDTIIRRRIRQKFEFIVDSQAEAIEPSEEQLQAFLEQNADAFHVEPRYSFRQIYLSPDRHGTNIVAAVANVIERAAAADADPATLGDPIMLAYASADSSAADVDRVFGRGFAATLAKQPVGEWRGPVSSGYGLHVVIVDAVTPGRAPALDEVREVVKREWSNEQRVNLRERFYEALESKYTVTIEEAE